MYRVIKWLALLVLVGVTLVGVLVARALTLTSRQVEAGPAEQIQIDELAVAARLAHAVREATVSSRDGLQADPSAFGRLHETLRRDYPRVHAALDLERVSEWSLLYTWQGRKPELAPVLFSAHLDVVP